MTAKRGMRLSSERYRWEGFDGAIIYGTRRGDYIGTFQGLTCCGPLPDVKHTIDFWRVLHHQSLEATVSRATEPSGGLLG